MVKVLFTPTNQSDSNSSPTVQVLTPEKGPTGYRAVVPTVSPTKDTLVITVATGDEFATILECNPSIHQYAQSIGADYIALTNTTQEWWGYEKFRVYEYAKHYKYTIFIDADCIVSHNCPNLVDYLGDADVAMHDDYPWLPSHAWMLAEKTTVLLSQRLQVEPYLWMHGCFNTGVIVSKQSAANIWKPPLFPLPNTHCAEQFWIEHQTSPFNVATLPRDKNNQWWMPNFESFSCDIKHYANCPNRVEIFTKMLPTPVCDFLEADTGECNIISELATVPHYPTPEECRGCNRCSRPRTVNEVTRSIANQLRVEAGLSALLDTPGGPGTKLASVLSWFAPSNSNCGCEERAAIMDAWGVQGCKDNLSTILHWLRSSAHAANIPYSEFGTKIILNSIFLTCNKS
jgi:hypothetical protein